MAAIADELFLPLVKGALRGTRYTTRGLVDHFEATALRFYNVPAEKAAKYTASELQHIVANYTREALKSGTLIIKHPQSDNIFLEFSGKVLPNGKIDWDKTVNKLTPAQLNLRNLTHPQNAHLNPPEVPAANLTPPAVNPHTNFQLSNNVVPRSESNALVPAGNRSLVPRADALDPNNVRPRDFRHLHDLDLSPIAQLRQRIVASANLTTLGIGTLGGNILLNPDQPGDKTKMPTVPQMASVQQTLDLLNAPPAPNTLQRLYADNFLPQTIERADDRIADAPVPQQQQQQTQKRMVDEPGTARPTFLKQYGNKFARGFDKSNAQVTAMLKAAGVDTTGMEERIAFAAATMGGARATYHIIVNASGLEGNIKNIAAMLRTKEGRDELAKDPKGKEMLEMLTAAANTTGNIHTKGKDDPKWDKIAAVLDSTAINNRFAKTLPETERTALTSQQLLKAVTGPVPRKEVEVAAAPPPPPPVATNQQSPAPR